MDLFAQLRPSKIEELICEDSLRKLLEDVLKERRFNTILLHGPSGIGKTTFARIFAETVNAAGLDCREENCGDKTGVDYAREWIKYVSAPPFMPSSKSKVLILDEAHKLTDANQNALLKGTEDLQETNYVVLCSTDPTKIINTLLSRCGTKINFTPEDIYSDEIRYGLTELAQRILKDPKEHDEDYLVENVVVPFLDSKTNDTFSVRDFISIVSANINDISAQNFKPEKDDFTKIKDYLVGGFNRPNYFNSEHYPRLVSHVFNMNISPEQCRIKLIAYIITTLSYMDKNTPRFEEKVTYFVDLLSFMCSQPFDGPDGKGKLITTMLDFASVQKPKE